MSNPQLRLQLGLAYKSAGQIFNFTLDTVEDIETHKFEVVKFSKKYN